MAGKNRHRKKINMQQMYVCSQLVKALTELEAKGAIVNNN